MPLSNGRIHSWNAKQKKKKLTHSHCSKEVDHGCKTVQVKYVVIFLLWLLLVWVSKGSYKWREEPKENNWKSKMGEEGNEQQTLVAAAAALAISPKIIELNGKFCNYNGVNTFETLTRRRKKTTQKQCGCVSVHIEKEYAYQSNRNFIGACVWMNFKSYMPHHLRK